MGAMQDLFRGSTHDYVDNPYWSLYQIKASPLVKDSQKPDASVLET